MQSQSLVASALLTLLAAGSLGVTANAHAAGRMAAHDGMEKCYGINAAHKNDCQSPGHSCAGQDARARDPQAFVAVPSGLCQKLAGGSLEPGDGMMMKKG
ncbi:MAG TPA: DUF2282 domain-containing protein [Frateuria sp.]|uniref:DUF2282 domain-containing protein n=1 Tax=Frateuria sp. TaxID=2211372 RepID=UPI002D7FDF88|nr:DUF2282 domain-containing protein [Frateuria sp.]HET6806187.1 DUF2282 domain-containing protein [Frateuria sp.]